MLFAANNAIYSRAVLSFSTRARFLCVLLPTPAPVSRRCSYFPRRGWMGRWGQSRGWDEKSDQQKDLFRGVWNILKKRSHSHARRCLALLRLLSCSLFYLSFCHQQQHTHTFGTTVNNKPLVFLQQPHSLHLHQLRHFIFTFLKQTRGLQLQTRNQVSPQK